MRLGVFGGTFDPIHIAHLIIAERVREEMGLDRVLFIPAALPPHKTDRMLSPAWQRLAMVRLAIAHSPWFEACDLEIRRGGISYTIDTLRELRQYYHVQAHELFLIIGSDSLKEMGSWREPESIFEECAVVVVTRPGFDCHDAPAHFARRAKMVPAPSVDLSSSEIRARVRDGKSIRYLVPPGVDRFIHEHGLYRSTSS